MDDKEYIKAHRSGDRQAFKALVDMYIDRIFSFAYRLSGDNFIAEDAVQETFIKVWKKLSSFDEDRSFKAWIFSIARNTTIDLMRKRKDVSFSSMDNFLDEGEESFSEKISDDISLPDIIAENNDLKNILDKVLAEIDVVDRSIVLLHDNEGLTFDEISILVKRPMNTVKSRYRRVLIKLRERLGGSMDAMHQKPFK